MTKDEMDRVRRFMRGDTEDMDFHEGMGDVMRKYIRSLHVLVRETGGGSLTEDELFGNLHAEPT